MEISSHFVFKVKILFFSNVGMDDVISSESFPVAINTSHPLILVICTSVDYYTSAMHLTIRPRQHSKFALDVVSGDLHNSLSFSTVYLNIHLLRFYFFL